jgi:serine phosphatase RsbU (regulator of sigma subunit)/integral membrane sensor domain MASE1/anti-sigma regulatory factor (Ser/Thr protein kinase)
MSHTTQPEGTTGHRQGLRWTWPEEQSRWRIVLLFVTVVLSYGVGSWIALRLIEVSELQGVLFIPSGITVAFLLRLRRRWWWVVIVAAGLTEFAMDVAGGFSARQALGFTLANVVEPLIGAAIVTTMCGAVDLTRRRHVLWFTLGAVIAGPAVGAALGAGTYGLFGGNDFLMTFSQWWLGDALGVILVGSAILALGSHEDRRSLLSYWGAVLIAGTIALTIGAFAFTDLPLVFSVLIGVVFAGALFGVRAVAVTSLTIALTIGLLMAFDPGELIIGLTRVSGLILIKLQVGLFTLSGLLIAAESHERVLASRLAARAALEAEKAEMERKRLYDLAVQVQKGLLPDRLPRLPGIQIAARYESATDGFEVGGDWYDAFQLDEMRVGLVVGDIVGHGIDAMTSMGRLRTALGALAMNNDDPAALLSKVDEFVGGPDGTAYATVFYAIVEIENGAIQYASAGHPPALLLTAEGVPTWLDRGQGMPLYGESARPRSQGSAVLEKGGALVLYSDGLVERRGESLDVGLARLERLASELFERTPEGICEELFTRFGVGTRREDDVVVLVMKPHRDRSEAYRRSFPAEPEELSRMRASIRSWAASRNLPPATQDDLLIAIGEATANSVRHAYKNTVAGEVEIMITPVGPILEVAINDRGTWQGDSGSRYPGMGRLIISSVAQGYRTESDERGTQVTFHLPITNKPV